MITLVEVRIAYLAFAAVADVRPFPVDWTAKRDAMNQAMNRYADENNLTRSQVAGLMK